MRILHIVEAFGGGLMGMVVTVAEGNAAAGHDCLIAYGRRPETPVDVRAGIDARVELAELNWGRRTPWAQMRAAREIRALVRKWRPDVVHLHSSFGAVVGSAAIGDSVPTVFSPNAFASALPEAGRLSRPAYAMAERWVCGRVNAVGAVSESEAELARALGARMVTRVPNGITELDEGRAVTRSAGAPPPEPPRVVAIGRTVPQRRPEAAARILAAVSDVATVEWLGGGGGTRGTAGHEALVSAGITPTGWLDRAETLNRMGSATAYLHWTAWDGLPLSVLEAVALDVVVVASDIPPNREILGGGGVCSTEEEAIALLRSVIADAEVAEAMRTSQRDRRGEFAAETMVNRWHSVYERLITGEALPAQPSPANVLSGPPA